jgi:hypothetical protein
MREDDDKPTELFEEVERRAYLDLPEEEAEEDVDLIAAFGEPGPEVDTSTTQDLTLGGYVALHNRPPAFSGSDNLPYTVDVDVEPTGLPGQRAYAAFLVYLRWAETGAGIMEHTESGDIAFGATAEEARQQALQLTLYEVKAELDAAIERKQKELEE